MEDVDPYVVPGVGKSEASSGSTGVDSEEEDRDVRDGLPLLLHDEGRVESSFLGGVVDSTCHTCEEGEGLLPDEDSLLVLHDEEGFGHGGPLFLGLPYAGSQKTSTILLLYQDARLISSTNDLPESVD